jgi:transposase
MHILTSKAVYKVHLTETCDAGQPHLITQVLTTPATTPDCVMGPTIQQGLAQRDLLPGVHLLDGGYVDAELLLTVQTEHQIEVVGPPFGRIVTNGALDKGVTSKRS